MHTNIPRKLNTGMWVVTEDERTGLLVSFGTMAGVDLVNEAGETVLTVQHPFETLRQATLEQIPEARRPTPEAGAALGYLSTVAEKASASRRSIFSRSWWKR